MGKARRGIPRKNYQERLAGCHQLARGAISRLDNLETALGALLPDVDGLAQPGERNDHRKSLRSAGRRVQLALVELRLLNLPSMDTGREPEE